MNDNPDVISVSDLPSGLIQVEARFGPNPQEALAAVDTAVFLYLRCTDMLATPNGVAAAMKTVSLEKYLFCRGWSGGLPLCAGVGWCGDEWPKV